MHSPDMRLLCTCFIVSEIQSVYLCTLNSPHPFLEIDVFFGRRMFRVLLIKTFVQLNTTAVLAKPDEM